MNRSKLIAVSFICAAFLFIYIVDGSFEGVKQCATSIWINIDNCTFLGKKAWDWLGNLATPIIVTIGAFLTNQYFRKRDEDKKRQTLLENYLTSITHLVLDDSWSNEEKLDSILLSDENSKNERLSNLVTARTLIVIDKLDEKRKSSLLKFLADSKVYRNISLERSNLENINLQYVDFRELDFSKSKLKGARLYRSQLSGAKFIECGIAKACFRNSNLIGADFRYSNLDGADFRRRTRVRATRGNSEEVHICQPHLRAFLIRDTNSNIA